MKTNTKLESAYQTIAQEIIDDALANGVDPINLLQTLADGYAQTILEDVSDKILAHITKIVEDTTAPN